MSDVFLASGAQMPRIPHLSRAHVIFPALTWEAARPGPLYSQRERQCHSSPASAERGTVPLRATLHNCFVRMRGRAYSSAFSQHWPPN